MPFKAILASALLATSLAACAGPSVSSVMRMKMADARPADCSLQLVQVDMARLTLDKQYDLLGYVMLGETGVHDPLSAEYRDAVRPKACAMGGTAVALAMSGQNTAMLSTGSGTLFAILRPYTEPSAAAPPTSF